MKRKGIGILASVLALGAAAPLVLRGFSKGDPPIRATRTVAVYPEPRVAVDSTRHSFGTMDVGQIGEHWFTIRNAGTGPLELRQGSTSCSCTLSDLEDDKVPPGGFARVRLHWKPPKPTDLFAQGATIHTNDPNKPSLYFSVVGDVRTHLGASPDTAVFTSVPLGDPATTKFVVYSQVWNRFDLEANCSHSHLTVETQAVDDQILSDLGAKCGYCVVLALAPGLKPGPFYTEVKLQATPAGADSPAEAARELSVPVAGQIAPSLWLEGPNLIESDLVHLGTIPLGKGKKRSMALFVRGNEDVKVRVAGVRPESLHVSVGPREQVSEKLQRYRIDVEVPKESPAMAHIGGLAGEIRLATDHPEAPEFRLKVDFAVVAPQ
jgi:hypothetical protein